MMTLLVPFKVILSCRPAGCVVVCVCVCQGGVLIRETGVCPWAAAEGQENLVVWERSGWAKSGKLAKHPLPRYTQEHTLMPTPIHKITTRSTLGRVGRLRRAARGGVKGAGGGWEGGEENWKKKKVEWEEVEGSDIYVPGHFRLASLFPSLLLSPASLWPSVLTSQTSVIIYSYVYEMSSG